MTKAPENPFKYGKIVEAKDLIPLEDKAKALLRNINDHQNTCVIGERRCGKTSLIFHVLKKELKNNYIFIDLFGIQSTNDLISRFIKGIIDYQSKQNKWKQALEILTRLRIKAEVSSSSDTPTIEFIPYLKEKEFEKNLQIILNLLKETSKNSAKKIAIFIDEFQEIEKLTNNKSLKGELRSQFQTFNHCSIIYCGSIRHQMDFIFKNPEEPFFKSAIPLDYGKIPEDLFYTYVKERLLKKKIKIHPETFHQIYQELRGISGDIQQFFKTAFDVIKSGTDLKEKEIKFCFDQIHMTEEKYYKYTLYEMGLSNIQSKILIMLAKHENESYTGKDFLERVGANSSSAAIKALNKLNHLQIIFKDNGKYYFFNPFFKIWLEKTNHLY
jgi:AAA+ ATPase superfamily predicted ATPase